MEQYIPIYRRYDDVTRLALLSELAHRRAGRVLDQDTHRELLRRADQLFETFGDQQLALKDAMQVKERDQFAVIGTRRAGKNHFGCRFMLHHVVNTPGALGVYINTTKKEGRRYCWTGVRGVDGIVPLNEKYDLGGVPNSTRLEMNFPRGGQIIILGADKEKEVEKVLGSAISFLWVDEAQKQPWIHKLIRDAAGAALSDMGGITLLTGTVNEITYGFFYDVTKEVAQVDVSKDPVPPNARNWHVVGWTVRNNPYFGDTPEERWDKAAIPHLRRMSWTGDEPECIRQWGNDHGPCWVTLEGEYVYSVHSADKGVLLYDGTLPERDDNGDEIEWFYAVGGDIGHSPSPFALVCWAFHPKSKEVWQVDEFCEAGLIADKQFEKLKEWWEKYRPIGMALDYAGGGTKATTKGWEEGYQERLPIPVEAAQKDNLWLQISLMNNDIITGNVHLLRRGGLYREMLELREGRQNGKRVQVTGPGRPNHLCDAARYGKQLIKNFFARLESPGPPPGTDSYQEAQFERMLLGEDDHELLFDR